jgi:hypothetical protein
VTALLKPLKKMDNFKIGQVVSFTNGFAKPFKGEIVKIYNEGDSLVIIEEGDEAGMLMHKAGLVIGTCINISQVVR